LNFFFLNVTLHFLWKIRKFEQMILLFQNWYTRGSPEYVLLFFITAKPEAHMSMYCSCHLTED